MWSILTSRFSRGIRSDESGQTIFEYLLVLVVIISIFMLVARPYLLGLGKKLQEVNKSGFFAEDSSGSNFYYYPLPK